MKQSLLLSALSLIIISMLTSCQPSEPYFSGGNQYAVNGIAPEGIKVEGVLWFHNTKGETGDHMIENIKAYVGDQGPLDVNNGRQRVVKIGGNARYDVPIVFYVPMDYVLDGGPQEATDLSNKQINAEFDFKLTGTATLLVGEERFDMPVEEEAHIVVWPDL